MIRKEGVATVIPHQNWRGQFARGTYPSGQVSDCTGQTTTCTAIDWPGYRTTVWHQRSGDGPDIRTWFGGLVDDMRDASGQMYRRNRYYDPQTGQFTQADPIGIAGGLNAYGFADGDPVTYSDPYGLCTPMPECLTGLGTLREELSNAVEGGRQWLSEKRQQLASLPERTRLYVRSGAAHLNSQFEIDGQGRTAVRANEGLASSATTAQLGVSVDVNKTPDDAVGTVRASSRILNLGVVRVSGTTTSAVSPNGSITPLTVGVEIGRSINWPGTPRGPLSGSLTTATGCIGSGCDKH